MAFQLCLELIIFSLWARLFALKQMRWIWIGPLSYLLMKLVLLLLLVFVPGLPGHAAPLQWALHTSLLAVPGIIILGILGHMASKHPNHPAAA